MPRTQVISASIVVLGQPFTPSVLTPDLFGRFFGSETPRGLSTNMISQVQYPESKYSVTLEETKLQVLKHRPTQTHLDQLVDMVSYFLEQNPLVRVTATGLNFEAFVRYSGDARRRPQRGDEKRFLATFAAPKALAQLVESEIESGILQVAYRAAGSRCRLVLRSDGKLNDNIGVALDLNVHRDVSDRSEAASHISTIRRWRRRFSQISQRLSEEI